MRVREGGRERMIDMRLPPLPRDKIYTIMCEMIVCVFWAGRGGELEGGEWVCAGFFLGGGAGHCNHTRVHTTPNYKNLQPLRCAPLHFLTHWGPTGAQF